MESKIMSMLLISLILTAGLATASHRVISERNTSMYQTSHIANRPAPSLKRSMVALKTFRRTY